MDPTASAATLTPGSSASHTESHVSKSNYSLSPSTIGELLHPGENLKRRQSDGHNAEFEVNKKFRSNSVTELEEDPVAEKSKSDDAAVSDEHGRLKRSSTNGDVYDVDVLYNVRTIVKGKTDREFFSEKPFKGLSEEIKLKVSVIEVITHIYGEYKGAGKPSQTRANFRTTPTIDFDEDFEIQTKRENLLSIPSKMIRAALDRIIDYYPSQRADGSAHHEPYRALAHHYPKLMAYYRSYDAEEASDSESKSRVNSSIDLIEHWADIPQISDKDQQAIDDHPCDKKTASHLRTLLQFITPWYKTNVLPELQLYEQKSPMATFDKLWLLFRPGDDVFVRSKINGEVEGYVVLSTEYKKADITKGTKKEAHKRLLVTVWRFAYDGVQLFRTSEEIELQQWSGEREVASLDVFPVKFLGDGRRSEERLVERGKRFFELIKEGHAFRTYLSPSSPTKEIREIILDPQGYREFSSSDPRAQTSLHGNRLVGRNYISFCNQVIYRGTTPLDGPKELPDYGGESRFTSYNNIDPRKRELTLHQCFLLPPEVSGFELKRKAWSIFEVDHIKPRNEKEEKNATGNLIIERNDLDILNTIPDRKAKFKTTAADFVAGKGEGRVFLFYGPPGTGKTVTAECIAKAKHRPLLKITNSDLGEIAMVEKNLQKWFTLAERWGAIMLIDEADNFLQKRADGAVKLNNLITVFLRSMEYFTGIIFLTTNIPGNIDDAFLSRISVPIYFRRLREDQCCTLWLKYFELHEKESEIEVSEIVKDWVRNDSEPCKLNGREIRNVMSNAIVLAQRHPASGGGVCVEKKHMQAALIRHRHFKQYIDNVKGESEKQRGFRKVEETDDD